MNHNQKFSEKMKKLIDSVTTIFYGIIHVITSLPFILGTIYLKPFNVSEYHMISPYTLSVYINNDMIMKYYRNLK